MKLGNMFPSVGNFASLTSAFSGQWAQAKQMAEQHTSKGQMTAASAKTFLTGVIIIFLVLIVVANFAPEAYSQVNESNLTDVPGGGFLNSTGILLIMLMVSIALVLKALDLV